jgi:hypothetical protein
MSNVEKSEHVTGVATSAASAQAVNAASPFKRDSLNELEALPPPTWLINRLIEVGAMGAIYGPTNEGKTFVGLDLALSIATGIRVTFFIDRTSRDASGPSLGPTPTGLSRA